MSQETKKILGIVLIIVASIALIIGLGYYFFVRTDNAMYIHNTGEAQGTTYNIIYQQPNETDLQEKIDKRLHEFDLSLSSYVPQSIISRINRNDSTVKTDEDFELMYKVANEVSKQSNGAFDITVGPLVKAWGFGFGNSSHTKIPNVKEILPFVGYHKIKLENHKLLKSNPHILIDANALAQGQSSDVIAKLLESNGCKNYMIEIGGEVVCKGKNPDGRNWTIGIDKPIDDSTCTNPVELKAILSLTNCGVSTSGNYHKFYYLNGKKYAHEIDPRTGYPVVHNLLSATVIAPTCIEADAYATAFMIVGVDSSLEICNRNRNLHCYLIYADQDGTNQVVYSKGFEKYLTK